MSQPHSFADAAEQTRPEAIPRRVWRSTVLLVLGRLWNASCTLIILYLLAGRLEGEGFGRFTFYLAIFFWLDSLATFGTGPVAVQRTADDPAAVPGVLAAARRIRLRGGLLGVAIVGGSAFALREPGAVWILLASLYPLTHGLELSATVFRNRIAWRVPVLMRAIGSALGLLFVLIAYWNGVALAAPYLLAVALGSSTSNLLLYLAARRYLPRSAEPVRPAAGIFRAAWPLGLSAMCTQLYFYIDNLFVRAIEGEAPLGHYNVAVRFMAVAIMIALYSTSAALPWFTRRHARGELGDAVSRLGPPLFALAGLGAGLAQPFTAPLLGIFGPEFESAAPSLRWLFAAGAVIYAGAVLLTAVIAMGRGRAMLAISATGLAVNVAGNTYAVPLWGIEGAAAATFATEVVVALGAAWTLARSEVKMPGGARLLSWLGGPLGFLLGLWLSGALAAALLPS